MLLSEALDQVVSEFRRSVMLHGNWIDYTTEQMMAVIIHELMIEAGDAENRGDITGEHGVIRELFQVASCSIKAAMVLAARHQFLLAQTSRPAGAHSSSEGFALPASLTHQQKKENHSNCPMGECRG